MTVSDLAGLLRTDLADPNRERFSDEVLARCIARSIFPVAWDLDVRFTVEGPRPRSKYGNPGDDPAATGLRRAGSYAATANAFRFSGDKRVDKTSQPEHWAKLSPT